MPARSDAEVLAEQRAGVRESALAGLKAARSGAADPAAPIAPAVATPAADAAPVEEPAADPAASDAVDPADPPADPIDPPKPTEEQAGAAAIRKLEQHTRRQLAEERAKQQADLDNQKTAWSAKLEKAAELERKLAAGREDPVALLKSLGYSDDDLAGVGRLVYGASTEGAKDPRYKAAGEAHLAKTQQMTQVQKLEQKLADLEKKQEERDIAAKQQAEELSYLDEVTKAIPTESPIAKAVAKHPAKVRSALLGVARELYLASGPSNDLRDVPSHAEVLAAYEKKRDETLEMFGIDPSILKSPTVKPAIRPAATLAPSGSAAPTPAAAVVAAPVATPTPVLAPQVTASTTSPKAPSREEFLANFAKLRSVGSL
jgi:hypothetical protein